VQFSYRLPLKAANRATLLEKQSIVVEERYDTLVMFRAPAEMDWTAMVTPGTSQLHAAPAHAMHMASPMVVSTPTAYLNSWSKIVIFVAPYLKVW